MTLNKCKLATSCSPEFESIPWLLTRDETPLGKQRTSQTSPSPEHYSSPAYRERIDLAAQEGRAEDAAAAKVGENLSLGSAARCCWWGVIKITGEGRTIITRLPLLPTK